MEEKYKYMFFKYIYNKLQLKKFEDELINAGINPIDCEINGLYKDVSKYFSLVNNVDITRLDPTLKNKYNNYFSLPIENLLQNDIEGEIFRFLEQTYKTVLFPNIKEERCFYGPLNFKYSAPRDSIVLGFNYCEFDIGSENYDEKYSQRETLVCTVLNYLQLLLSQQIGMNISVIKYNEYSFKKKVR